MANSEISVSYPTDIAIQIQKFKRLRRGLKMIKTPNEYLISKQDIETLMDYPTCGGLRIDLALDQNNMVNIYLEPFYIPGTGPVPGPGVGHTPAT